MLRPLLTPDARTIAVGAIAGAILSVTCVDVLLTVGPLVLGIVVAWFVSEIKARRYHVEMLPAISAAWLVLVSAYAMPVKFLDRRADVMLSAEELPLNVLANELAADQAISIFGEYPSSIVRLPSRSPTYRQLDRALREHAGYRLRVGYCGNGWTVLFGAHPISGPVLEEVERK